jgi:hypothetical protein
MSWIVQNLWNNRIKIKGKSREGGGIAYRLDLMQGNASQLDEDKSGYDDPFIENEEFNDLLMIERAVSELTELKLLSEQDLKILYDDKVNYSTKAQKETYAKKLSYLCQRIAYYLGGYFTDEGYIHYLSKKYKLTEQEVEIVRAYMSSRFKNKILKKGYRIENNDDKFTTVSAEV